MTKPPADWVKPRVKIRYLIQSETLSARKVGGRWVINSDDLPLSDGQQQAVARKEQQLRHAVEDGLGLPDSATRSPRYSVRDLKAFQIALPIYQQAMQQLGTEHSATHHLHQVLQQLSIGCHRFEQRQKSEAYRQARDTASLAVCELILCGNDETHTLSQTLEQELMAALAGLLRRLDKGQSK